MSIIQADSEEESTDAAIRLWTQACVARLSAALTRTWICFAFYSETDTFGNVVLEALASGVPAVVTDKGGPKFIVEHNRSGYVCSSDAEFAASVLRIAGSDSLQRDMAVASRLRAERASWDAVFHSVYETYCRELPQPGDAVGPSRFLHKLAFTAPRSLPFRAQKLD